MSNKRIILSLVISFSSFIISANNNLILKQLSIEQRLPGVSLQSIYQDRYGIMWFGIESVGLCKYDGQEYTVYENITDDSTSISNNFALSIIEDINSAIWVGTTCGLNKFDRKSGTFKRFLHKEGNNQSLPDNYINTIIEDKYGYLWIGTTNGLCKFNPFRNEYIHIYTNEANSRERIYVSAIHEDLEGNIWLGSWQKGLAFVSARSNYQNSKEWESKSVDKLTSKLDYVENFLQNVDANIEIVNNKIRAINHDENGLVYIGTFSGVYVYNIYQKKLKRIELAKYGVPIMDNAMISSLLVDKNNNLWIGTASDGISVLNMNKDQLTYLNANDKNINGLKSNSIRTIIEDKSGLVWIGTKFQGIQIYDPRQTLFEHIFESSDNKGLSNNFVLSIYEDINKNIWIGTKEGGLNRYNPITNEFIVYKHNPYNKRSLKNNRVECIIEENNRFLWIGTANSLERFDKYNQIFEHYSDIQIKCLALEKDNNIWIGTYMQGLYIFNKKTKLIRRHKSKHDILFKNEHLIITNLFRDSKGYLWIGTSTDGLFRYNYYDDDLIHYTNDPQNERSLSGNMIRSIFEDSKGNLWIGTKSDGLNKLVTDSNIFIRITDKDGLSSNTIYSMLEDEQGNLWMGTHNGLTKYNIAINKFINFDESYGLQGKIFEINAYLKASNGIMYFGGSNGFNYFDPLKTSKSVYIAPVVISSIKIYDKVIDVDVTNYQEYTLDYRDKYISFNYSLLDYSDPLKNQYAYKLENFDKDWIYSGNRHYASYTSLTPGEYIFHIIGANLDNDWNEDGVRIKLYIPVPFWKQNWFIIAIIIGTITMIVGLYLLRVNEVRRNEKYLIKVVKKKTSDLRQANEILENQKTEIESHNKILIEQSKKIRIQNKELEQHRTQLEKLVSDRTKDLEIAKHKAEESDRLKSAFLANMSHEIRTPLNAVVGFSDLLSNEEYEPSEIKRINKLIKTNSQTLLQIINDIIDISKIEANQLVINKKEFNINSMMYNLYNRYHVQLSLYCQENDLNIELLLEIKEEYDNLMLINDSLRIEQIYTNLFSNALKFTKSGTIKMGYIINNENELVTFYMSDTGIGIAPENLDIIFDRFRKIEEDRTKLYRGTGLGLSICLHLAKMMDGRIWVESKQGVGSTFFFEFPLIKSNTGFVLTSTFNKKKIEIPDWSNKTILIVEDEESNIELLKTILKKTKINIEIAVDGIEAIEACTKRKKHFDLILMDIKLPRLNGIEASKKIKSFNKKIPIIAQTAYAMQEEEKEIMKVGFSSYISKPIMTSDLIKKISEYID